MGQYNTGTGDIAVVPRKIKDIIGVKDEVVEKAGVFDAARCKEEISESTY